MSYVAMLRSDTNHDGALPALPAICRYFRGSFAPSSAEDRAAYTPGRERYLPDLESTETILGEEQWAWLEEQFLEPATVRVVVASFQLAVVGHGFERWGLIPAELQRFYNLINSTRANGVVVLSGDRHIGAIYKCVSWTNGILVSCSTSFEKHRVVLQL